MDEILVAIDHLQLILKDVKRQLELADRNCYQCDKFNQAKEICNLCNQRPPVSIIVTGCDYFLREVPF